MEPDETELVTRVRAGDATAFDALYRSFGARVLGFALRLSENRAEAEDLVQEVFIAAYGARTSYRGRSRLLTWLLGIAARRWRDRCRYDARRPTALGGDELLAGRPATGARVEEQVVETVVLDQALAALDVPFREALLLVHSQGLSYREAAQALGVPIGTVKWRVFEATRRLRRHLEALEVLEVLEPEDRKPELLEEQRDDVQQAHGRTDRSLCRR
ncbi:MAG: polymerase, sigma-24 subunit, subfamily [Armatimonadetes bacterium]|jgi:RNA polymerase sigma-70 factor (ECF subfamily)|nr:polymerase, sigma-24 subunit, subfamily [Armatimonadota bacterium]